MPKKILIVDDEPNIVMTLEYAFKKQGYDIFIARDGLEAIKIIDEEIPHVIVLDIMMPKIDGFETLNYIRNVLDLKETKVVFLSARNKEEDIKKGLELGADRYLTKPFSIKKLTQEIQDLLNA